MSDTEEHSRFPSLVQYSWKKDIVDTKEQMDSAFISLELFRARLLDSLVSFRMSVLEKSTIIKGVAYVFWLKDTKEYSGEDIVYGVVYKGNAKFGHQDFSIVAQKSGKYFWSKKVDEEATECTWKDCVEALELFKDPAGDPLTLTDRAYTFAELAKLCYDREIFTSPEGKNYLQKKTKLKPVGDKEKNDKNVVPRSPLIPDDNIPGSLEDVVSAGDEGDAGDDREVIEIGEGEGEEMSNLKEAAAQAESKCGALNEQNIKLLAKINDLENKLQTSLQEQQKFMVAGDTANMSLNNMNDDTATTVVKQLESKLSLLSSIDNNITDMMTKVTDVGNATAQLPNVIKALKNLPQVVYSEVRKLVEHHYVVIETRFDDIESKADTSSASLNEGLLNVQETLAAFGFEETEEGDKTVNIPACIESLVAATKLPDKEVSPSTQPRAIPSKGCYYQEHRLDPTFVCKCGCGGEVQLGAQAATPTNLDVGHAVPGQAQFPGHYQFLTPGNHQQASQQADHVVHGGFLHQGQQYAPSKRVDTLPAYGGPMYNPGPGGQYGTQMPISSADETLENNPTTTRKQKKQIKDQEYKAKKQLKFESAMSQGQGSGNQPQHGRPQTNPPQPQHETPQHLRQQASVNAGQWSNASHYMPRYTAPVMRPQNPPTITFRPGGNISPWLENRFPKPPQ